MCGIVGLVLRKGAIDAEAALTAMSRAVAQRGPDGDGMTIVDVGSWRVGLAQRRLAIINLTPTGAQPMRGRAGRTIVYNGETYNYAALEPDLRALGAPLETRTDTEVVLEAHAAWGIEGLARLRGMFAFAILDEKAQRLTLARDPMGIKPLYVYASEDVLVFASEVRALLASGLVPRRLDALGLQSMIAYGSVQAPRSMVDGVRLAPAGHVIDVDLHAGELAPTTRHYASPFGEVGGSAPRDRDAAVTRMRAVLEDSVRHHLVSDVPVGIFLSGGIDSTALVGLVSRASPEPARTFTVVHDASYSEGAHAARVAERFGTRHHEIALGTKDVRDMVPEFLSAMDQPSTDGLNTFCLSKAVRKAGVTVALSGLGADEMFGGYYAFERAARMRRLARVPRPVRGAFADVGRLAASGTVQRRKAWSLLASEGSPEDVVDLSRRMFLPDETGRITGRPDDWRPEPTGSRDPFNAVTLLETRGYMSNTLLRDADVFSMAHGLEIRVPYVDVSVAREVISIPGRWKKGARPKALLVDACHDLVPDSVWSRPKEGFRLPFEDWLATSLRASVAATFDDKTLLTSLGLRAPAALEVWRSFEAAPPRERWSRWSRPWGIHVAATWCDRHGVALEASA